MESAIENVVQILAEKIMEYQKRLSEIEIQLDDLNAEAIDTTSLIRSTEEAKRLLQGLQSPD